MNWGATLFSYFNANVSDNYTFYVASDNGAQIYLNGSLLLDNSGKPYLHRRIQAAMRLRPCLESNTVVGVSEHRKLHNAMHKAVDAMPSNCAINVFMGHACCCRLQCLFCTAPA